MPPNINTDNHPAYSVAIKDLKKRCCPKDRVHRQVKYLNNIFKYNHDNLKRIIKPTLGFKTIKSAYATSKDF